MMEYMTIHLYPEMIVLAFTKSRETRWKMFGLLRTAIVMKTTPQFNEWNCTTV